MFPLGNTRRLLDNVPFFRENKSGDILSDIGRAYDLFSFPTMARSFCPCDFLCLGSRILFQEQAALKHLQNDEFTPGIPGLAKTIVQGSLCLNRSIIKSENLHILPPGLSQVYHQQL